MTTRDLMLIIVANTVLSATITVVLINLLGLKIINIVFEENKKILDIILNCINEHFRH